jgi:hypothetical protein
MTRGADAAPTAKVKKLPPRRPPSPFLEGWTVLPVLPLANSFAIFSASSEQPGGLPRRCSGPLALI